MLAALALFTIVVAAASDDNGSYSLIIKKEFDKTNVPEEVWKEAENQKYTFQITGTRINGKDDNGQNIEVPVNETLTLPRKDADGGVVWESDTYKSNGPFNVTVTEITDNIDLTDNKGNHYNMTDSSSDAMITVNSRKHEMRLRNNSILTIQRPEAKVDESVTDVLWYHLTSRPYDEHDSSSFEAVDKVFSLAPGEEEKFGDQDEKKLGAAIYTIEQIAAPDGYQLQLGNRREEVPAGKEGHFHINGTPGQLALTAGGTKGDGATHYYKVERTETESGDTSEFTPRIEQIESGETHIFPDLPKGGYTVTEYSYADDASTEFSVTMPQTDKIKTRTEKSSAPQFTGTGFKTFPLTEGTTYFKLDSFGPLYATKATNAKPIDDPSITYDFAYGWGNEKGGLTYSGVKGGPFKANETRTMKNAAKRYPHANTLKIGFRTQNVSDSKAKYLGVSWTEYTEKEVTKTCDKAGMQYTSGITIDDRGWLKITAPTTTEHEKNIKYYYTLRNSKNKVITGVGGTTDDPNTTVMLEAGQDVTLTGLDAGSYKITETVEWKNVGFTMQVSGNPFGTTEAGKSMQVQVGGERELIIRKPAVSKLPTGAADERDYTFTVAGGPDNTSETVTMKAGEDGKITLKGHGTYTITPQNDVLGTYFLGYKDSGAIYGTASGGINTITFTNVFRQGDYGYRYIHEYYIREENRAYTREGESHIGTILGRDGGETYDAGKIKQVPTFQNNNYTHFDEAYGWVDPRIKPGAKARASPRNTVETDHNGIITKGKSSDSEDNVLHYGPEPDKDNIEVTKDASRIIILRYYRDREPKGTYNVIHVYYRRDQDGDHWEGTSGVRPQDGELGIQYTGDGVEKEYEFKPPDGNGDTSYTYTWDNRPQYGVVEETSGSTDGNEYAGDGLVYRPNNAWTSVEGTQEGNQIIILRYYREPGREGTYNIVHEYYFREPGGNLESEQNAGDDTQQTRAAQPLSGQEDIGEEEETPDASDTFSGTIDRNDGFVYTFEGRTSLKPVTARLNTTHTAAQDDWQLNYENNRYAFLDAGYGETLAQNGENYRCDPNQQWAASTEDGDEVIILRYVRQADVSYRVVHEYYVRNEKGRKRLVGTSEIRDVTEADAGRQYTHQDVTREPRFRSRNYRYFDYGYGLSAGDEYEQIAGKPYVLATNTGEEIIILRYIRDMEPEEPEEPEEPPEEPGTPDPPPETPSTPSTPSMPSEPPVTPPDTPEEPPQPPATPDEPIVPPTPATPQTGDSSLTVIWAVLAGISLSGAVVLGTVAWKWRNKKDQ